MTTYMLLLMLSTAVPNTVVMLDYTDLENCKEAERSFQADRTWDDYMLAECLPSVLVTYRSV